MSARKQRSGPGLPTGEPPDGLPTADILAHQADTDKSSSGWTKVPHALIDTWAPLLSHTACKLLLVLLRETHGWNRGTVRMARVLLKRKTGIRDNSAFARARRELEHAGLLHVSSENGKCAIYTVNLVGNPTRFENIPSLEPDEVPCREPDNHLVGKPTRYLVGNPTTSKKEKEDLKKSHQRSAPETPITPAVSAPSDDDAGFLHSFRDDEKQAAMLRAMAEGVTRARIEQRLAVEAEQQLEDMGLRPSYIADALGARPAHEVLFLAAEAEHRATSNPAGYLLRLLDDEQPVPATTWNPWAPVCVRVSTDDGSASVDAWVTADKMPLFVGALRETGYVAVEPSLPTTLPAWAWVEQPEPEPTPPRRRPEPLPSWEESMYG